MLHEETIEIAREDQMNFFIRRNPKPGSTTHAPSAKKFGNMNLPYRNGLFNKYLEEISKLQLGSDLASKNVQWVENPNQYTMSAFQAARILANTIDSLMARCTYDIAEYASLHGDLYHELMPQISSRHGEAGWPILTWNYSNEALSIRFSSLTRTIILNIDSLVEAIYLFSYFPFLDKIPPDKAAIFNASEMAKVLKNSAPSFTFTDGDIVKKFQIFYQNFGLWEKRNNKLRNHLTHFSDIHTTIYSEEGKMTAGFCCVFNDTTPIENDLTVIAYEEISQTHVKMLKYVHEVLSWYRTTV